MLLRSLLIRQMRHRSVLPVEYLWTQIVMHLILIFRGRQEFILSRRRHQCLLRVVGTLDRLLPTLEKSACDYIVFARLFPDQAFNSAILLHKVP